MGIDLKLLPIRDSDEWVCAVTVLSLDMDTDLFDLIRELPTHPAPAELHTYFERNEDPGECMALTTEDAYGTPLTTVAAADLVAVPLQRRNGGRTAAVWAYLRMVNPKTRVVLYWD